jgi:transcription elongation factor GreA
MKRAHLTKEGYEKFKKELETLQAQRPDAVMHLKTAREMGDLSENGYYKASRAKLSFIDNRLFHLKMLLKTAQIIEAQSKDSVSLGCRVVLHNEKGTVEYMVVGAYEANPSEGRISNASPLGKALLGKRKGDSVTLELHAGQITYTIVEIL